ncbi:substrate-binding periplasmic protein [Candidatus Litorirhabdus singularis]|nr:transporter substrate-binding domain-containing protein [Candidatus Litorirhabdus singularis]
MLNRLLLAAVLVVSSWSLPALAEEKTVSLMVNTWSPYVDKELPGQGVAMELVTVLFDRAGYRTEIKVEAWRRAMEGVRVGLYDALGATWYTESREQDFIFSEPYLQNDLMMLKLRAFPGDYLELSHLSGRRLGLLSEYEYGIDFAAIPGLTLVPENHDIQSLLNLINRKVDFVIGDRRALVMQLDEFLSGQKGLLVEVPLELPARPLYVAASRSGPQSQEIIDAFNRALAAARSDGSYDKLLADWSEKFQMQR